MNPNALVEIPGYDIGPEIGSGANSVVYRATKGTTSYAVKVMRPGTRAQTVDGALRFRREAAILGRLSHPGLVRVIEAGEQRNHPFLVMELISGQALADLIARGPLAEDLLLRIGRTLAGALGEVHRHGLVHRDIKPANIIIDSSGDAKLIDFGLAAEVERTKDTKEEAVGTFRYAAPEQIGVLNRPVDGRADLYSFGILLFECATGRPPFEAKEIGDLIQQHAAVVPILCSEINSAVSPVLAAIIAKLLAKDPDDRYQTAHGLRTDLEGLKALEAARFRGEELKLAADDLLGARVSEVPLVGRRLELSRLEELWTRAASGAGSMVLLEGEGGSGKSRLCLELLRKARDRDALILSCKCQRSEQVPLGSIREAMDDYVTRVLRFPAKERRAAIERMHQAAGEFAPLIKRLSRGLERVFKDVVGSPEVDQDRYYDAVSSFLISLSAQNGHAILWVDDVQWLDDCGFLLLTRVASRLRGAPFFLLTTGRNDPESQAASAKFADEVAAHLDERMTLHRLTTAEVGDLVAAHLGGHELEDSAVVKLAAASNGNPFAVGEYVRSMIDTGIVRPAAGKWEIDTEALAELTLPKDELGLVVQRVKNLQDSTIEVLCTAAVIGLGFQLDFLIGAMGGNAEMVHRALADGLGATLVERKDAVSYTFVHDRVREALLRDLTEEQIRDHHQAIAETMDLVDDVSPEHICPLARHYTSGYVERNPKRIFETSLSAGLAALESNSYADAYEFLTHACTAATRVDASTVRIDLARKALGQACAFIGRPQEAADNFQLALQHADDPLERARIHVQLGHLHVAHRKDDDAWKECILALAATGKTFHKSTIVIVISAIWTWFWLLFFSRTEIGLRRPKPVDTAMRQLLAEIYDIGGQVAFFQGNRPLIFYFMGLQLLNGHWLGVCREHAKALATWSLLRGAIGPTKRIKRARDRALSFAEQLGDRSLVAFSRVYYALGVAFTGDFRHAHEAFEEAMPLARKWLAIADQTRCSDLYGFSLMMSGRSREGADLLVSMVEESERTKYIAGTVLTRSAAMANLAVLGRNADAERLYIEASERLRNLADTDITSRVWHAGLSLALCLETGDLGQRADDAIALFEQLKLTPAQVPKPSYHYFIFHARLHWERYRRATPAEKAERLARVVAALRPLRAVAKTPAFRCQLLLIKAGIARERDRYRRARRLLDEAERLAHRAGSEWGSYEVAVERARMAVAQDQGALSVREALVAREFAVRYGWRNRLQKVSREFDLEREESLRPDHSVSDSVSSKTVASSGSALSSSALTAGIHLDALLQVSLASASTLDPTDQARATLDEIVKVLGAERAFLFLTDSDSEDGGLILRAGRDTQQNDLIESEDYSSTVVNKVAVSREPLVVTGTEEGEMIGSESAVAYGLRSIMAAPLLMRERLIGVVYLDSRLAKGMFKTADLQILLALANHIAIALETARAAQVEIERQALEMDMALTAAVQSLFLPKSFIHRNGRCHLAGFYRPAAQCGGDWWWYDVQPEDSITVLVGDVTGHGAASAMVTASVATSYQVHSKLGGRMELSSLLETLNDELLAICGTQFGMTMSAMQIDFKTGRAFWLNAGAPPLFVMDSDGKTKAIASAGTPLGSERFSLGRVEWAPAPGDRILMFTDGLNELRLPKGRQLGLGKLMGIFSKTRQVDNENAPTVIIDGLDAARKNTPQDDDIAFAVIDINQ